MFPSFLVASCCTGFILDMAMPSVSSDLESVSDNHIATSVRCENTTCQERSQHAQLLARTTRQPSHT